MNIIGVLYSESHISINLTAKGATRGTLKLRRRTLHCIKTALDAQQERTKT